MNVSKIYLHLVLICPVWASPVLGVLDIRGDGNGRPCGQLQASCPEGGLLSSKCALL